MTRNADTHNSATTAPPALKLERVFNATPERLWSYWTDPAKYALWLNPAPIDLVIHEWDLRVGGKVRFDMPQPDGNKNPQEGVFHVLDPYNELQSGSPDKSFLITVRFARVGAATDEKTRMTVVMTGVPAEYHQMATEGWNKGFDKMAALVAKPERERAHGHVKEGIVHVERWFKASPEKVFKAWSDPRMLEKFFWPVGQGKVQTFDFKVGGALVMAHATEAWTATWTFAEIVPNKKIVTRDFWPDGRTESVGTLEFIPENGGTRLKVTDGPFPPSMGDSAGAAVGFSMVADRLAEEVEVPGKGEGFVLERFFKAKPAKVWQMWTTKEGLAKWWGPSANAMGYEFKVNKLDVRVGGEYDIQMSNKAHGELHNHGVYTQVVPNRLLAQRWEFDIFLAPGEKPYPITITIALEEVPTMEPGVTGTKMTFTQGPMAQAGFTEGSRQGVIQNLSHLAKALGE